MSVKPHGAFEKVVLGAIVANFGVLVWSWLDGIPEHEHAFEIAHLCFLGFFSMECGVRLRRHGWKPRNIWRDKWLVFDAVVIAVALIPVATNLLVLQAVRSARLIHTFRHLAHAISHVINLRSVRLFWDQR